MARIAITGVSGYIGKRLLGILEQQSDVERIIGIDVKAPKGNYPKLIFSSRDVRQSFTDIFVDNRVDAAIHMAFAVKPSHDASGARDINIKGAQNFLEACRASAVQRLLYLSSHTVYGPHPDNPVPLTEDSPPRPIRSFQYSWDKAKADAMVRDFADDNPGKRAVVLRCCPVLGPEAGGSVSTGMFKSTMVRLRGYDPLLQFVHEDDVARLMLALLEQGQAGVFNCGGEGFLSYKDVIAATGRRCMVLSAAFLSLLLRVTWRLRLQSQSPPGGLEFIKYPVVLSTEKVRRETGFQFRYTSREVLLSYLKPQGQVG